MNIQFESLNIYILVFVRLIGMVAINPLLSRRNIPSMVRMGLVFFLTVILMPTVDATGIVAMSDLEFGIKLLAELAIGAAMGFVFQIFYYMLFFAGDYLDTAFGLSMAKVFDPGTNVQMSVTSNFLSIMFVLYIFATDSHLVLIHLFATSFKIIPIGGVHLSTEMSKYVIELFIQVFSLILRLVTPFAVAEFTLEMSMGILMKIIPQITIFVINFQLKLGLGILMLIMFASFTSSFVDNYIVNLFDSLQKTLYLLAGTG